MPDYYWAMDARTLTGLIADFNMRVEAKTNSALTPALSQGERDIEAARKRDSDDPYGLIRMMGSTAVISIQGPLMKKLPGIVAAFCPMPTTVDLQNAIEAAVSDQKVERLVLLIDSPGGSVDGSVELADTVFEARQKKPVVAQVDGLAASAGYWIASQATEIVSNRSALIGSIGVFSVLYDMSRLYENEGVKVIPIATGPFKTTGMAGTRITEDQIKDEQRVVDAFFDDFKKAIARGRPQMAVETIEEVSDGRVFKADSEALGFGLIDRVGYFRQTINQLNGRGDRKRKAMQARVAALGIDIN